MIFAVLYFTMCTSPFMQEIITPLPLSVEYNKEIALLGKKLFHDTGLSSDATISCASCHRMDLGGVDRMPVSIGVKGQLGAINSPTVFNSAFNFAQFWDGRAKTLAEQLRGPVENPVEMGTNFTDILAKLSKDGDYVAAFNAVFNDGVTEKTSSVRLLNFKKHF